MPFNKGNKLWDNPNSRKTRLKKGQVAWNKGTKGIVKAWNKGKKGKQPWHNISGLNKKGGIPWNKGLRGSRLSEETKAKMKGRIPWNKGMKGEYRLWLNGREGLHSPEARKKMSESRKGNHPTEETRRKMSETHKRIGSGKRLPILRGARNHLWKGGISNSPYSTDWTATLKRAIRERDNYICQVCSQYGWIVHHIDYNKKNCNPDNLITLCKKCHNKTNLNRAYWLKYFKTCKKIT
jgi:hypothetical protein